LQKVILAKNVSYEVLSRRRRYIHSRNMQTPCRKRVDLVIQGYVCLLYLLSLSLWPPKVCPKPSILLLNVLSRGL